MTFFPSRIKLTFYNDKGAVLTNARDIWRVWDTGAFRRVILESGEHIEVQETMDQIQAMIYPERG